VVDLVRKQTYITADQDRALKRIARRDRITEAEVVRRAIDFWLEERGLQEREDPFATVIAMFHGPSKVDHDDIYR
jgi:hypothetical protein